MSAPLHRPLWLAWLAILFLGSQFVAVHHQSAVAHRHCVEHGRLEHVAHDDHGHARDEEGPQAVADAGTEDLAHEACALAPCLNERAPQAPSRALPAGSALERIALAPVGAELRRGSIALLRLAPKQSPPA
jgi:hypothetical protein